ncbi:MAG: alpha/beta hydrolase [Rubritepida sp.]|nr:alpha/beta hydrolase [Rubritepida sp.]
MIDFAEAARTDPARYERAYNPRAAVADLQAVLDARAPFNARAMAEGDRVADLAYGPHPRHRLDIWRPAGPGSHPAHLFFHGGYWRSGDKANFAYLGAVLAELGITTAIANYELCPASNLDAVVASALSAFAWVTRHIGEYGGDPVQLTLSGHSAGAHLCAAILADPTLMLPAGVRLLGTTMLSGAFDPSPAVYAGVNAEIGLTSEVAARQNLERKPPRLRGPISILVGGDEPQEWIDLSLRYAAHLRDFSWDPSFAIVPDRHHFSILDDYRDAGGAVQRSILQQIAAGRI